MARSLTADTATGVVEQVDAATLRGWLAAGEAVLVDVRNPNEYAAGHIPGARLLPLPQVAPERLPAHEGRRLVVQCQSGMRATAAADQLASAGLQVWCYRGGMAEWQSLGYPTEGSGAKTLTVLRQVQLIVGTGILTGTLLGALVHPGWLVLPGCMGAGLMLAGSTGNCPLAILVAKLPWNAGSTCSTGHCEG